MLANPCESRSVTTGTEPQSGGAAAPRGGGGECCPTSLAGSRPTKCSGGHAANAIRPPRFKTLRISERTTSGCGAKMWPNWLRTTSKLSSRYGNRSASPSIHSDPAAPGDFLVIPRAIEQLRREIETRYACSTPSCGNRDYARAAADVQDLLSSADSGEFDEVSGDGCRQSCRRRKGSPHSPLPVPDLGKWVLGHRDLLSGPVKVAADVAAGHISRAYQADWGDTVCRCRLSTYCRH